MGRNFKVQDDCINNKIPRIFGQSLEISLVSSRTRIRTYSSSDVSLNDKSLRIDVNKPHLILI